MKYLYNHKTPETAYVVEDYPWGFRLRTTIRYWIESKSAKNGGERFCSQTINPKTGQWCAPKYSTYSPIMIMFLNKDDHVKYYCLNHYDTEENINLFKETHLDKLSDFQKDQLKLLIATSEIMKHVSFDIRRSEPVSLLSKEPDQVARREQLIIEREEIENNNNRILSNISKAINMTKTKVVL